MTCGISNYGIQFLQNCNKAIGFSLFHLRATVLVRRDFNIENTRATGSPESDMAKRISKQIVEEANSFIEQCLAPSRLQVGDFGWSTRRIWVWLRTKIQVRFGSGMKFTIFWCKLLLSPLQFINVSSGQLILSRHGF